MVSLHSDIDSSVQQRFGTNVTDALSIATLFPNTKLSTKPGDETWCDLNWWVESAEWTGTANGGGGRYEIDGRADATFRAPIYLGDKGTEAAIDATKAAFDHVDEALVRYGTPRVEALGALRDAVDDRGVIGRAPEPKWYGWRVSCPFRVIETAAQPLLGGARIDHEAAFTVIRERMGDQVEDPQSLPVEYDNEALRDKPANGPWARHSIRLARTNRPFRGPNSMRRHRGIVIVKVFVPGGLGTDVLYDLVDVVYAAHRGVVDQGVTFRPPVVGPGRRDDKWWGAALSCGFHFDQ